MRSRVGLVLIAIAVGGAGVALYLTIDASQNSSSSGEVQRLQRQIVALHVQVSQATQLSGRVDAAHAVAHRASAEVAKLQAQVQSLQQKAAATPQHTPSRSVGSASSGAKNRGASSTGSKGPVTGAGKTSDVATTTVSVADNPKLGKILVDSHGLTLYDFRKDTGTKSACYGSCAKIWPPLTTSGTPQAAGGAEASKLGTTRRTDGTTQVTYDGHPLYTYAGDTKPGEVTGNGLTEFGGSWHALSPTGKEAGS